MSLAEHLPVLVVAVPLLAAFITPLLKRHSLLRNLWVLLSLGVTELMVLLLGFRLDSEGLQVYTLGAVIPSLTSPEGFPVRIILEVDGMSFFIALASVSIVLAAAIYSVWFMKKYRNLERYYSLLLLMLTGMKEEKK
ncbi:MAG TPA: hypothetical protein ENG00_00680 [Candidatus Aenigmarchaeota archaeon]|nr:hypothetical protein [Candidatus Aenigmarchaeota archaeon]